MERIIVTNQSTGSPIMNQSRDGDASGAKCKPEIVLVTDVGECDHAGDHAGTPESNRDDPRSQVYTYDAFGDLIEESNGARIPSMPYDGEPRLGDSEGPPLGLSLEETDPLLVNFPQIYALISRCYWQLGKLGEAYDWCSAGRDNNPDDAELMRLAADLRFAYLARRGPRPTKNSDPAS